MLQESGSIGARAAKTTRRNAAGWPVTQDERSVTDPIGKEMGV